MVAWFRGQKRGSYKDHRILRSRTEGFGVRRRKKFVRGQGNWERGNFNRQEAGYI